MKEEPKKAVAKKFIRQPDSTYNLAYISNLAYEQRGVRCSNFIELHKAKYASKNAPAPVERSKRNHDVFNYSVHELNSTEQQLVQFRSFIKKNMRKFTLAYGTEFFSQSITPVDLEEHVMCERAIEKMKWKTADGFKI